MGKQKANDVCLRMEQAPILFSIFILTIRTVLVVLYLFKCFLHQKFKEDAFIFMVP